MLLVADIALLGLGVYYIGDDSTNIQIPIIIFGSIMLVFISIWALPGIVDIFVDFGVTFSIGLAWSVWSES